MALAEFWITLRRIAVSTSQQEIPTEAIARRAYELWESRGCPPGDGSKDWDAAVAELASRRRRGEERSGGLLTWFARVRRSVLRRDEP